MENPVNKADNERLRNLYLNRENTDFADGENYAYTAIYNALTEGKIIRIMGKQIIFAEDAKTGCFIPHDLEAKWGHCLDCGMTTDLTAHPINPVHREGCPSKC
jgi:hypothetical protein